MSDPSNPFDGLNPALKPHPPAEMPGVQEAADATANLSPFLEALDADKIIANLTLDRPLSLYIPGREKYPDWEFHIINSIPREKADALNKGFREITDPALTSLFTDLVAGHDKDGKTFRPLLMARPKAVGEAVRKRQRQQLQSLYAGMDPKNKELSGKYTSNVDARDGTFLNREGAPWRIRTG